MKSAAHNSIIVWGIAVSCFSLVAGREFYKRSIVPLREKEPELSREVAELSGRIESAKRELAEIRGQGQVAESTSGETTRLKHDLAERLNPLSVPVAVSNFSSRLGLAVPVIRRTATENSPEISGYERSSWEVSVSLEQNAQTIASLLRGMGSLDSRGSNLMVRDFTIWPDPEDSTRRRATIHVTAASKIE